MSFVYEFFYTLIYNYAGGYTMKKSIIVLILIIFALLISAGYALTKDFSATENVNESNDNLTSNVTSKDMHNDSEKSLDDKQQDVSKSGHSSSNSNQDLSSNSNGGNGDAAEGIDPVDIDQKTIDEFYKQYTFRLLG